jgi:hypothetical protein
MPNSDENDEEVTLQEPIIKDAKPADNAIWMRLLYMVILAAMFALAEAILVLAAILQFGWLLFAKKRNDQIAELGGKLGKWMHATADFQTARTEDKPFPWRDLD